MIVDAHTHLKHEDIFRTEYSPEEIVETMDRVGIDLSVVFAMSITTKRSIEMALEAWRKFPNRLIPFVYALPSYERPVIEELRHAITNIGFKEVKIHAGECTLAEYVIDPVIGLAEELDVPCLIDCAGRRSDIKRIAESFPNAKIIMAHFGRYLCGDEKLIDKFIDLAITHKNIYLDTSGVVLTHKIREAVHKIGSNRIVFGTEGPHKDPDTVSFAAREINKIRNLNLDPEDEENILGGSILEILRI